MKRALFLIALAAAGCLPQVGAPVDGGEDDGADAGAVDAGSDAGSDAGCAGPLDCASGVCAAGACVAPANPCAAAYANCFTFDDFRDGGAVVRFQGANKYSPPCVRVRFGQTVRFEGGTFFEHPLAQSCGPVPGQIAAGSGNTATFTFDRALGTFGYHCTAHGSVAGSGMAGAIEVVR